MGVGTSTYAMTASGNAALIGIDALTLSGSLAVQINNTGAAVNETILVGTEGDSVDLVFADGTNIQALQGSILIDVAGFVSIEGDFGFEKTVVGTQTKILVGAANVNIFLGTPDKSLGVSINDVMLAMMLLQDSAVGTSTYAMTASGNAALIGIDALTLSGSLAVQINNTGLAVDETILVGTEGDSVDLVFADGTNIQALQGSILIDVAGFVSIEGDFGFEKTVVGTQTKILVGAANVNIFLGTPDKSLGVSINDVMLAMMLLQDSAVGTSTYAMTASGNA